VQDGALTFQNQGITYIGQNTHKYRNPLFLDGDYTNPSRYDFGIGA
jgi:hypothetical protein